MRTKSKMSPRWSLILVLTAMFVACFLIARIAIINHYKGILLNDRGVPEQFLEQSEIVPDSEEATDQLAFEYFFKDLVQRGVPGEFVQRSKVRPLDIESANIVALRFFRKDLIQRGISPEFIELSTSVPLDIERANEIAFEFFKEDLVQRGVLPEFIGQSATIPLDIESTNKLAFEFFEGDLIRRGVPSAVVLQAHPKPTSLSIADALAVAYFTEYLIETTKVSPEFLEDLDIDLISLSVADQVEQLYIQTQSLEHERLKLLEELVSFNSSVQQEQMAQFNAFKTQIDSELRSQIDQMVSYVEADLQNELDAIENAILGCTATGFIPFFGDFADAIDALVGRDHCTGGGLQLWERILNIVAFIPGIGDLIAKGNRVVGILRGFERGGDVIDIVKAGERVEDIDRIRDAAVTIGRGERFDELINMGVGLSNVNDLDRMKEIATTLARADTFHPLADAFDELHDIGAFDPSDLDDLSRSLESLDGVVYYEQHVKTGQQILSLSTLAPLEDAAEYVADANRAQKLSLFGKFLRYSGLADDVHAGILWLRKNEVLTDVIKQFEKHEEYLLFVINWAPDAREASWVTRALEGIRKNRPYRQVSYRLVRAGGKELVALLNEEEKEIWITKYYAPGQNDSLTQLRQEIESYRPLANEGYQVIFFYSSKPPSIFIEEVQKAGFKIYWGPDNLPPYIPPR